MIYRRRHVLAAAFIGMCGLLTLSAVQPALTVGAGQAVGGGDVRYDSNGKEWPLIDGDWGNQRYTTLTQITAANVKELRGAWVSEKFAEGATSRAVPVVKDGLMFLTTQKRVIALDPKTGRTVWSMSPANSGGGEGLAGTNLHIDFRQQALKGGLILPNNQGVAVADGLVFLGLYGGEVMALRATTGEQVWRRQTGDDPIPRGQAVSGAVTYANGIVFSGLSNGDFGVRGRITALDAKTGRELWRFFVVPRPGEPGTETWPKDNNILDIGGGAIWRIAGVDPDLGLVYFGTGNASPPYGGELRPGNNLYTVSVVALNMKTGKLAWHQQLTHHELWEGDIYQPVMLYDVQVAGRTRKVLAVLRRPHGHLFQFDRATGEPLVPVEERPVPQSPALKSSPTQPYPTGDRLTPDCSGWNEASVPATWRAAAPEGFKFMCADFVPPSPTTTMPQYVTPGGGSGPMLFSRETGYIYVFVSGGGYSWQTGRSQDPWFWGQGSSPVTIPGAPPVRSPSFLAAVDGRNGKIVWKKEHQGGTAGALATATGLLLNMASNAGALQVFDARTGDLLHTLPTGGVPGAGGAPSSYEIDGEQYVAVSWGPEVRAFKIGGTLPVPPVPPRDNTPSAVLPSFGTYGLAPGAGGGPGAAIGGFSGPIQTSAVIETATLLQDLGNVGGTHYLVDEYAFKPYRTRITAGERIVWGNNGKLTHTIVALDGSWTTGPIPPGHNAPRVFDKPGAYGYYCKEHPWSYGQLIVDDPNAAAERAFPDAQVARGQTQYNEACSQCHGPALAGVGSAPPLAGPNFLGRFASGTVEDLYARIKATMPVGRPGSLPDQAYLDIVTFLIRTNGLPGPATPLQPSSAELKLRMGMAK